MHPAEEHTNPHRVSDLKYQQFLLILPIFLGDIRELLAGQDTRWCLRVSEVG